MTRNEAGRLNPLIGYLDNVTLNNIDTVVTLIEKEQLPATVTKLLVSFVEAATRYEEITVDNPQVH